MIQQARERYEFGPFHIDAAKRLLLRDGETVPLSPKGFEILLVLVEGAGKVVSKDELMQRVWPDSFVEDNNLTYNISVLRKALGEHAGEHHYIVTVPTRGYRFVASVREIREELVAPICAENGNSHEARKPEKPATISIEQAETETHQQEKVLPSDNQVAKRRVNRVALTIYAALIVLFSVGVYLLFFANHRIEVTGNARIKTIAVLPFKPILADRRDEWLEMGMSETLITKLSQIRELRVLPISAVRKYTAMDQDAAAAGRELGVDAVLDAIIQKDGNRIRLTWRLLRTNDGTILWADKCDEQCTNLFDVQDSISEKLTQALALPLTGEEKTRLTKRYTENTEAFDLYLKGRFWWGKRTEEGFKKALEYFKQAIEKDGNYALAYAGLADTYGKLSEDGLLDPKEASRKGKEAVQKALALDPRLAEAHASLAATLFYEEQKFMEAESEYIQAINLNPNSATGHYFYGSFLSLTERHTEAIAERRKARELEPSSLLFNWGVGWALFNARQYDEAIAEFGQALEMDRSYHYAFAGRGLAYLQKQQYDQAIAALQELVKLNPTSYRLANLGYAYAAAGQREKALKILKEVKRLEALNAVHQSYPLVILYAGLGNKDEAFANLEKAFVNNPADLMYIKIDPLLDSLRTDPRFQNLLQRLNLALKH